MDALVLYPHQDHPGRALPVDGQGERHLANKIAHQRTDFGPIAAQLGDLWPVVVGLVQIVPAHLVHPDGDHGLDAGIQPLVDQARRQQFVDEEGGGVAVVEDERMAQRDRLVEPGPLIGQTVEQRVVEIEGLAEVGEQLAPFLLGIAAGQQRGASRLRQTGGSGIERACLGHALTPCWQ